MFVCAEVVDVEFWYHVGVGWLVVYVLEASV